MDRNIKIQKTQALLQEILTTALSELNDPLLRPLSVTRVLCSKGKYHAKVFIESSTIDKEQQAKILSHLNRAKSILREYVLSASGWFKCPDFSFVLDDELSTSKSLDALFEQIKNQRNGND
ncbi:30S ribosome-binding factor RbfA [uncultured Helicobacter sp.]|uniref:30S ribosome-binding factor RbfA n=1 Tax=uncultured Helicobacter sp. TaxID=175537 RepID=UPI00374EF2E7